MSRAARTTLAAVISAMCVRACHLPEPVWAVITTIIVMQSSLGAAWQVSRDRFLGTAMGSITGAVLITFFRPGLFVLALGMLVLGWSVPSLANPPVSLGSPASRWRSSWCPPTPMPHG